MVSSKYGLPHITPISMSADILHRHLDVPDCAPSRGVGMQRRRANSPRGCDELYNPHTTKVNRPGRSYIQSSGNKPAPSRLVQARLVIGFRSLSDCARRTQPRTSKFLVIDYILSYLCRMSLTKLRRHVSCIMNNPVARRNCELSNWPSTHRNSGTTRVPLGIPSVHSGWGSDSQT